GAARAEVAVGPRVGHDAAVVKIGAGRVMVVTTDPLSLIPALGLERSARLACHLIASDLWTTGIPPAYVSVDFNLPPSFDDDAFGSYWRAMSDEWAKLGVAVVTGHTGRHPGCGENIIGAATLIGVGDEGRYITPAMARPGDQVIVSKGCAIEAAAIAALAWPERLGQHVDPDGLTALRALTDKVSARRAVSPSGSTCCPSRSGHASAAIAAASIAHPLLTMTWSPGRAIAGVM